MSYLRNAEKKSSKTVQCGFNIRSFNNYFNNLNENGD